MGSQRAKETVEQQIEHLWKEKNYEALVDCYAKQFYRQLKQEHISEALTVVHDLESLIEEMASPRAKMKLIELQGVACFYHKHTTIFEQKIVRDIPKAKMNQQFELLCLYYLITSYLKSSQQLYEESVNYAKMAQFFAQKAPHTKYSKYVDYYLVISYLNHGQCKAAKQYLKKHPFNEGTTIEIAFQAVYEGTLCLQEGQLEEGLSLYESAMPAIIQNTFVPINLYIGEHMALQLSVLAKQSLPLAERTKLPQLQQRLRETVLRFQHIYNEVSDSMDLSTERHALPYFLKKGVCFYEQTPPDQFVLGAFIQLKPPQHLSAIALLQYTTLFRAQLEVVTRNTIGKHYFLMVLDDTTFIVVSRHAYAEQVQMEQWFQQIVSAINAQWGTHFLQEDVIVVLGNQMDLQATDFYSMYSKLLAKVYNKIS